MFISDSSICAHTLLPTAYANSSTECSPAKANFDDEAYPHSRICNHYHRCGTITGCVAAAGAAANTTATSGGASQDEYHGRCQNPSAREAEDYNGDGV